ncbi:hypothetical protein IVB12_35965 [Bradyrhizobium sp. 179]|uniref:hypothetical protein n=1 Tax=Bradyrhizobium sp. 179 TaxID=2782648 RepID=UPI001FF988A4|nr:hypothetical protein [Bradyrhizobium sp. 179]MCK1547178.1 hypothetical protein [Bradyrhizobium sp. 179]
MTQFSQIAIDFEIHKMIEAERRGFDEEPYVALRRLLGLPEPKAKIERVRAEDGAPWSEDGIIIPHGSQARMEYQRGAQVFEGAFLNGQLVVNGKSYDTLSAAATDLARTKGGKRTSLNGWSYWKVKIRGEGPWRLMLDLRRAKQEEDLAKLA